ncbi:hypothetical protein [Variovorax sp. WS11]|uniref:hypothetical protein n=1 Tax=Variovorax sp. WS11 TaxID=1105204 RepID=UPI0013DA68A5|nr:hypothetical protein [Variovorax sp. WS11]NDZ12446.1 hypothetical protein [Variovorax sp. WS11]
MSTLLKRRLASTAWRPRSLPMPDFERLEPRRVGFDQLAQRRSTQAAADEMA